MLSGTAAAIVETALIRGRTRHCIGAVLINRTVGPPVEVTGQPIILFVIRKQRASGGTSSPMVGALDLVSAGVSNPRHSRLGLAITIAIEDIEN